MPSEVKILTRNYLDGDSAITSSHGGTTSYLFDRDKSLKWTTVGANRDAITVTLTMILNEGSTETQFNINTLILNNTNVKHVLMERWTGSAYVQVFQDDNASGVMCRTFGAILTSRVRLTFTTTQAPNKEKYIGQLILARVRHNMSDDPVTFNFSHRENKETVELANGNRHVAYTAFTGERVSKYGGSFSFEMIPQTDYDFLECLKNEGEPFLWYPESDFRPQEIYYVNWVNSFSPSYTGQFKAVGYSITLEIEEV